MFRNKELICREFIEYCKSGDLESIKQLMVNPSFKSKGWRFSVFNSLSNFFRAKVDIHYKNDMGFVFACKYGHLNTVKYLLECGVSANASANNGFCWACKRNNIDIVHCLIFVGNLENNFNIHKYFIRNNGAESNQLKDKIDNWFKVRDLNDKLEKGLSSQSNNKIKKSNKI